MPSSLDALGQLFLNDSGTFPVRCFDSEPSAPQLTRLGLVSNTTLYSCNEVLYAKGNKHQRVFHNGHIRLLDHNYKVLADIVPVASGWALKPLA